MPKIKTRYCTGCKHIFEKNRRCTKYNMFLNREHATKEICRCIDCIMDETREKE
jgi:hypothetical protein